MTTIENMNTNKKTTEIKDRRVLLSTLWLFAMLTYTYGDVVTLMDPIKHGSIPLTEGFLLGGSIFMMIPISMVLLSRILKYRGQEDHRDRNHHVDGASQQEPFSQLNRPMFNRIH